MHSKSDVYLIHSPKRNLAESNVTFKPCS